MTAVSAPRSAASLLSETKNVLIGTGKRTVKLGFVEIHVYSLKVFVDAPACRAALVPYFGGMDLDGLLRASSTFYPFFTTGKFKKVFELTFCRSLTKEKLVGGFEEPLKTRCDHAHQDDASLVLSKLVPESGVVQGDVLCLVCHGDGETLTGLYTPAKGGDAQVLVQVSSGGKGGAWLALQNIYFDNDSQLPTIRVSAIQDLPNVLMDDTSDKAPSQAEIESAVQDQLLHPSKRKQTWSEFAGRTSGKEGYEFGDLTLGVVTAVGLRKKARRPVKRGQLSLNGMNETRPDKSTEQDFENQVKQLQQNNQELQQSLIDANRLLLQSDRELLFRIVVALTFVEAMYILMDSVVDFYVSSLHKFQFYIVLAIFIGGYNYYSQQQQMITSKSD